MALTFMSKNCDNRHAVCNNNMNYFKNSMANLTKANFDRFIDGLIGNGNYNNCLSSYSNRNYETVIDFIVLGSRLVEIAPSKFISMCQLINFDDKIISMLTNQLKMNPNYKRELINCKTAKTNYGSQIYFMSQCFSSKKIGTIKFMMGDMEIDYFFEMVKLLKDCLSSDCEHLMCDYINKNESIIKTHSEVNTLIDSFINKPKIIKTIYRVLSSIVTPGKKLEILNKVVLSNTLDVALILNILEGNDVMPNNITIDNLLSKVYFRSAGAPNARLIAEIIDIFVLYGFKITKDIVIKLLKKSCYINSIEKYPILIDESILEECAELSYYPYDFMCVPPPKVMLKECGKENNIEQIKKLKEKGGVITVRCLEKACGVRKNGRVLKYIISECGVKPDEDCLIRFQLTHCLEALDLIMKHYSNKKEEPVKSNKIELDNDSTMTIEKRLIEISPDLEYVVKNKIKKLFDYKKKTIKYADLYELMLKYLISHKLIIGNYFVINSELCNLLKINQCTIVNIDQLDNILSYFIDVAN